MNLRTGAIVGFGNVAALGHLPAWLLRSDAHIVAVVDVDPARHALARSLLPGVRVYDDVAALLARERLDFVDIATPPATHAALILQALRAGCDVLCEKPLVTTLDDFERVQHAARAANLALMTVHNWKHSPQFKHVADLVTAGAVGRLNAFHFETERNGQSITVGSQWRQRATQAGGGILVDHGWHGLYLALALAGEPPHRIRAVTESRRAVGDVEDTVECALDFPSSRATLRLTWAADQRRTRWSITGSTGALALEDDHLHVRADAREHSIRFDDSLSAGSHHAEWFGAVIDEFFHAVDHPQQRNANLAEAEWCLRLITLAYQSAATGTAVAVPPIPMPSWRAALPPAAQSLRRTGPRGREEREAVSPENGHAEACPSNRSVGARLPVKRAV